MNLAGKQVKMAGKCSKTAGKGIILAGKWVFNKRGNKKARWSGHCKNFEVTANQ